MSHMSNMVSANMLHKLMNDELYSYQIAEVSIWFCAAGSKEGHERVPDSEFEPNANQHRRSASHIHRQFYCCSSSESSRSQSQTYQRLCYGNRAD